MLVWHIHELVYLWVDYIIIVICHQAVVLVEHLNHCRVNSIEVQGANKYKCPEVSYQHKFKLGMTDLGL